MKSLTQIIRLLTGLLFIFSGFVKGIDPMGTAFKFGDYFTSVHLTLPEGITVVMAVILCLTEFMTGIMLLTGAMVRTASWMAALFMAIFTPLTLLLALFNPVSDCGCFGDAIHLTNWQTFYKNIFITALVIFVFIRRNDTTGTLAARHALNTVVGVTFIFLLFLRYNLAYLPMIDFRPYKTGVNIPEGMSVPADAPADIYDVKFIYEKDGISREFTLNDYPANDSSWKFVDQKSVLVSKGYTPPIHDFRLVDQYGDDLTGAVTEAPGYTVLMVTRKIEKAEAEGLSQGYSLGMSLRGSGTGFYIVTSTPFEEAGERITGFNTLFADETTLKTVIRSNPGFLLIHDGTIIGKWSSRKLPPKELFLGNPEVMAVKELKNNNNALVVIIASLIIVMILGITFPYRDRKQEQIN